MHEHEVRETPSKGPKPGLQRAPARGNDLLSLQRLAGNSAVTQHVQRADVQIDELTSTVRPIDNQAQMGPGTESMIEGLVHDTAKAAGGSSESSESSGPSTLPPGGHATMEEEPG